MGYQIKKLELLFVILSQFIQPMRIFKHVELVNKVKLLVARLAQIKIQRRGSLACLLLDLHKLHELLVLD